MDSNPHPSTLGAYLDDELPAAEAAATHDHLAGCSTCAAEVADLVRLQRNLRTARHHFAPSADFRERMQQQIAVTASTTPPHTPAPSTLAPRTAAPSIPFLRLLPFAFAAAALVLGAFLWVDHTAQAATFTELADLHVNALASANPLDVVSTDRHTVKPWFQGKIPFSFNLPDLSGSGFTLLGGRLVYLQQQPGAQLIVAAGPHKISVLIFQDTFQETFHDTPSFGRSLPVLSGVHDHNTFHTETWQSRGLRFVVLGDTDPAAIDKLASAFRQSNP